jgi:hypothetical protein
MLTVALTDDGLGQGGPMRHRQVQGGWLISRAADLPTSATLQDAVLREPMSVAHPPRELTSRKRQIYTLPHR